MCDLSLIKRFFIKLAHKRVDIITQPSANKQLNTNN